MNQQQIAAWLRITLAAGGPIAALIMSRTGIDRGEYQLYLDAFLVLAPPLVAAAWSWYRNREDQQIKAVESLPAVATVVVKDTANGKAIELAKSEEHPNIVTETQNEKDAKMGTKT